MKQSPKPSSRLSSTPSSKPAAAGVIAKSIRRHPMFGFLCAACGRCLEELPAWQLGAERFHCGIFCREGDEGLATESRRASPRKA